MTNPATSNPAATNPGMTKKEAWLLFIPIALVMLMIGVDLLGASLALTPMSHQFGVQLSALQWFMTSFGIGNAAFLVTSGVLADRYGHRRMLMIGMFLFVLSSLLIAFSPFFYWAVFFRLLQGASGGVMASCGVAILSMAHSAEDRGYWLGTCIGTAGVGMAVGPVVGGFLVEYWGWRLLFLINLPIGVIAFCMAMRFIRVKSTLKQAALDIPGILLFISTVALFVIFISEGGVWGWSSATSIGVAIGFICFLFLFLYCESHVKAPMLHFELFRKQNFLPGGSLGAFLYLCLIAWVFSFTIFYQHVMNFSAVATGLHLMPMAASLWLGSFMMKRISAWFSNAKNFLAFATLLFFLGFATLAVAPLQDYLWVVVGSVLVGFGFILINANTIAIAVKYLPMEMMGLGAGTCLMMRWLGGSLGAVVSAGVMVPIASHYLKMGALAHPQHAAAINQLISHGFMSGTHVSNPVLHQLFSQSMVSGMHGVMAFLAFTQVLSFIYIWKGLTVK